jgi:Bacterial archaeo-eukaryotic release factor family 10
MNRPSLDDARELLGWEAPFGVVSVYLGLDPGDRGGAWRTRLGNGLERLREAADGAEHERKLALRATAERIAVELEGREPPLPRGEAGFVEVAARAGAERWWPVHVTPRVDSCIYLGEQPVLAPLLDLSCRACPYAVALLSSERVRLLRWAPGELEQVEDWELSVFSDDWRERKAQAPSNPAAAQGVSASGHDRFDSRLQDSRDHFLSECGELASRIAAERGLDAVIAFGSPSCAEHFGAGFGTNGTRLLGGGDRDLISVPAGDLEGPIEAAVERLELERDKGLAEQALNGARGGGRGSAGLDETAAAVEEARVETLLLDLEVLDGAAPRVEPIVRRAISGGAAVAPVSPVAGGILAASDGVAAILRY